MGYLKNAWYAAAFARDVTREPLRRVLLDQPVVLFRTGGGQPAALADLCPHRLVPLSRGRMVGDNLECGYHGLRFDRQGACVFNPHGDGQIPRQARVRSFPVVERYGFVWFWPGDPERADDSLISSEFHYLSEPDRFAVVSGYLHIQANYQLVVDNLLDLSHAPFVHPQFGVTGMSAQDRLQATQNELVRDGDTVWAKRTRRNSPPNDLGRQTFRITAERVDTRTHMHWMAPSNLHFDVGLTPPGEPDAEGIYLPAAHLITPETEFSSHYFFAQARNTFIDDEEVGRQQLDQTEFAFRTQDQPMLEAQQAAIGPVADLMTLKPVLLQTDAPSVAARRILSRLIEAEQRQPTASETPIAAGAAR